MKQKHPDISVEEKAIDKFNLRLPDGMRVRLEDACEKSGRSMTKEILFRISHSLDTEETMIAKMNSLQVSIDALAEQLKKK